MSDRITDTIAEALGQHRLEKGMRISAQERTEWVYCVECGWESAEFEIGSVEVESVKRAHQVAAVLAALRANNIEPIQLPEPVHTDMGPEWPVQQHWNGQEGRPGSVYIRRTDGRISATSVGNPHDCPTDARSLAAALLAAAATAEEGKP